MSEVIKTRTVTREYEEGFERAFGGEQRERRAGRARYVWDEKEQRLVPVSADWQPSVRRVPVVGDAHYDNLRATDGTDISSRTKHRQYMKDHNLTLASDFTQTWAKSEEQRGKPVRDPERREQIGRALYEASKRR